jgi:hypothetical protein
MCDSGTYVNVTEAAQLLETTETRVLMMLKKNELAGKMVDDVWCVEKISLNLCSKPKAADIVRPGGCGGGCGSGCGGH